jgi:hypothetical protein
VARNALSYGDTDSDNPLARAAAYAAPWTTDGADTSVGAPSIGAGADAVGQWMAARLAKTRGVQQAQMQMHPYDMLPLFAGPSDMDGPAQATPPKDWLSLMLDKRQPDANVDPRLEIKPPDPLDYLRDRLPFRGQHVPRPFTET